MTDSTPHVPPIAVSPTMTQRPLGTRWARDVAFHATGLVAGTIGFAVWMTAVGVGVSLAAFIVGVGASPAPGAVIVSVALAVFTAGFIAALIAFHVFRLFARLERRRAALALGAPIPERYRPTPRDGGWLQAFKVMATDPATWKDFTWTLLCGTVGLAISSAVLTAWTFVLGLITTPLWYWTLPEGSDYGIFEAHTLPLALLTAVIGVALIPVAGALGRWLAIIEGAMMRSLLQPSREGALADRVEVLTSTRAAAVDAQAAELRRIERDLHDGAQARLVALALNLGMAEEKLDSDPEQARELLAAARGEARTALQELRDLARGIHPPILTDRGLEAAVTALAARSPLAVTIEAAVPDRLPPAVEAAAYFVVAEALANATKHARATRVLVRLRVAERTLAVEVADDGVGGADSDGAGLVGLRRRVEALDGTLRLISPPGGGTTLHAELPCGS